MLAIIKVDFRNDWKEFLEKEMATYGLQYAPSKSVAENTGRYLNAKRRIPRRTPRNIHESGELRIPLQYLQDYEELKRFMRTGGDLKLYLSRDVQKEHADKNDKLLNAWGIQHLHFRPSGTGDVLFVKITDADVFVIQCLSHGCGHSDVWVDTTLPRILHENWPDIEVGKLVGIHADPLTPTQMLSLRKNNANFAIALSDGTVCVSPNGGLTSSGRCVSDIIDNDRIIASLDYNQKLIEANELSFREALNLAPSEELSIKLIFDNDHECWLYEPNKQARFCVTIRE